MRIQIIASLVALAFAGSAAATPISFTYTGSGSGTLGGTAFSNTTFTITALADTDARVGPQAGSIYYIDHLSSTIDLSGVGSYSFLTQTRTFANNNHGVVGFSRGSTAGSLDLYNSSYDPLFATWDMLTSIGPVASNFRLIQWLPDPVVTDGGALAFDTASGVSGTFTATLIPTSVPEPSTLGLLSGGLLAAWLIRRRPRHHAA